MSFYTYKNSKITLNGVEFLTQNCQINVAASLAPNYLEGQRHSFNYQATNGIGGLMTFVYTLTGNDPLKTFLAEEETVISGNFGGLHFKSGYLQSYSLRATPNKSVLINAEVVFYDELKGVFAPTYERAATVDALNFANAQISDPTNGNIGSIENLTNFSYAFRSEIQPLYLANESLPARVVFGPKEISSVLVTDNLNGDLPISGKSAGITVTFTHPNEPTFTESYQVSGVLGQRSLSVSVGEHVQSELSIRQNYVESPPVFSSFNPGSGAPGDTITIIGENLSKTTKVWFGEGGALFDIISDTQLNAIVPEDALTGPITIETFGGRRSHDDDFIVNYNPVIITALNYPTGHISGSIYISGNNFYYISDVVFTDQQLSNYVVLNPNLIRATVPEYTAFGPIWIVSARRDISGDSNQNFVPFPIVESFTPSSGQTGDLITINGRGFSGVTGVLFNNLPNTTPFTAQFTVNSNTEIKAYVPTGNFKGAIRILGQSGVYGVSSTDFSSVVSITGLNPTSARTGDAIEILGLNFYADILYPVPGHINTFLVQFGNPSITGNFIRVNSTKLTGVVPYDAKSGPVYLYDPNLEVYSSTGDFRLRHGEPLITSSVTQTGYYPDYAIYEGSNLINVTSVELLGPTGNIVITDTLESELGDVISFQFPVATGGYYHLTVNTSEGSDTFNSGLFIRDVPIFQSVIPSSGVIGELLRVTGKNLYHDSRIYINTTGIEAVVSSDNLPTGFSYLDFYVPVNAPVGLNDILLFNQRGWVTGENALTIIEAPFISGFDPLSGVIGDTILITGHQLENVTGVYFGSGLATYTVIDNSNLEAVVPSSANSDYITIYYGGGSNQSENIFTVMSPVPAVTNLIPSSGFWRDDVIIKGTNLNEVYSVTFSGDNGNVELNSEDFSIVGETGIHLSVPVGTVSGPLLLQTDRLIYTTPEVFHVLPSPYISSFYPETGIYQEKIYVSGSGLAGRSILLRSVAESVYIPVDNLSIVGDTGASFNVPREIVPGPIYISGENNFWQGSEGSFYPLPTIYGIQGANGQNLVINTGQSITVSGINAASVSPYVVFLTGQSEFHNILSGAITKDTSQITGAGITSPTTGYTLITFKVNSDYVKGGASIFFVADNFSGITTSGQLTGSDYYDVINTIKFGSITIRQAAPSVTTFTPTRGSDSTTITLWGNNLKSATGIYLISGVEQSNPCTILNTHQNFVQFSGPELYSERSGQLHVYTLYGDAITTGWFTHLHTPTIQYFSHSQGITGSSVLVSGSGIPDATGLYFGSYSSDFEIIENGGNPILSGIVPTVNEFLPWRYRVRVMSEGGESFSFPYTIYPYETQYWGDITGRGKIYATGFVIQTNFNTLSDSILTTSDYEVESGIDYIALNSYIEGYKVRIFSIATEGF